MVPLEYPGGDRQVALGLLGLAISLATRRSALALAADTRHTVDGWATLLSKMDMGVPIDWSAAYTARRIDTLELLDANGHALRMYGADSFLQLRAAKWQSLTADAQPAVHLVNIAEIARIGIGVSTWKGRRLDDGQVFDAQSSVKVIEFYGVGPALSSTSYVAGDRSQRLTA